MKIIGTIIAGGQSRRMEGREKAFLQLRGKTLLDWVSERLAPQVDQLVINANGDPGRFAKWELQLVSDEAPDLSTPLAGLHASLQFAASNKADFLITCPSDAPFLPHDLVKRLVAAAQSTGAAIASSSRQSHFLTGAWSSDLLARLEHAIQDTGVFRVKDWVSLIPAAIVEWQAVSHDPFFNVNTPQDLAQAEIIAGKVS